MVVAVIAVVAVLVALAAFVRHMMRHDHPEKLAGHDSGRNEWGAAPPPQGEMPLGAGPAGPGTEGMAVPEAGDISPSPEVGQAGRTPRSGH